MNKFLSGLFVGIVVGAGGTVAVLCKSQTVRIYAKQEVTYRIQEAVDWMINGPEQAEEETEPPSSVRNSFNQYAATRQFTRRRPSRTPFYGPGGGR